MSGLKNWYIYTMEYYATERKKEVPPFTTSWMELENIMLSEISQVVKDKYHMTSLITGIYKQNKLMRKIEPETWKHGTDW